MKGLQKINAMTIDLEDWYQTQDFDIDKKTWDSYENRIEVGTERILDLLSRYNIRATFFVLGYIAKKNPTLVRKIASCGHEIASHGVWHQMVSSMTPEEFRKDVVSSKKIIEDTVGSEVIHYRAPSWSISSSSLWALRILEEEGFLCDSSIQPFRTPLSGMKKVSHEPFRPIIEGEKCNIIEFPPTVLRLGKANIPFSGGFYLRFWPYFLTSLALSMVNRKETGMIYVHPWELDTDQPRLQYPLHIKMVHYYNLKSTLPKLDKLFRDFNFAPLGEVIKKREFPYVHLE